MDFVLDEKVHERDEGSEETDAKMFENKLEAIKRCLRARYKFPEKELSYGANQGKLS
jgi:hypothetical protein